MPYTNCSACGAKALVGATRCPRCQAPFVSYDLKGDRVPTVNCPKCGVQRPVAIGVCPNCVSASGLPRGHVSRGTALAGLVMIVILAIGYGVSRQLSNSGTSGRPTIPTVPVVRDSQPAIDSSATNPLSDLRPRDDAGAASKVTTPVPTAVPASLPPSPQATATRPVNPAPLPPRPASPPSVVAPDTGVWEYAVAMTWVRVRSGPSRESDVLRMIDSAQRVRLGPPMTGWRPVRVGVDRGWVDPRLFKVVSSSRP